MRGVPYLIMDALTHQVCRSLILADPECCMDSKSIANLLTREHPQTIAVVLVRLNSDNTREIFEQLPRQLQGEVISRIATLDRIAPEILLEVDEYIASMLKPTFGSYLRSS